VTESQKRPARRVERDLQAVGAVAQAVLDSDNSDALLSEIAHAARTLVAAKVAMVITIAGEPEVVTIRALVGVSGGPLAVGSAAPLAGTAIADLVRIGSIMVRRGAHEAPAASRSIMDAYQVGPVVGVPLSSDRVTRGALFVGKATGAAPFRQADIQLIATFAHQAASAIHLSELRAAEATLTVGAEHDRIARDLHDGVVQSLYGLGMSLRASITRSAEPAVVPIVHDALDRLDEAIAAVRKYIAQLELTSASSQASAAARSSLEPPTPPNDDRLPRDVIGALGSLAEASLAGRSLASVLGQIVTGVVGRTGAAFCVLGTVTEDGRELEIRAVAGPAVPGRNVGDLVPLDETLAAVAIRRGRPIVVTSPEQAGPGMREPMRRMGMGPVVAVPMSVRGRAFGGLAVGRQPGSRRFSRHEVNMIEAHAVQAAIALEFDRVREELRRGVVIEERRRVGTDLHDRVIQMLFGIGLTLQSLEGTTRDGPTQATLRTAVDSIDRAIRDLRRYVFDSGPSLAVDRRLDDELRALVADLVAATTLDLTVDIDPAVSGMVADSAGDILQIASEGVSNVVRHANANHCLVRLLLRNGEAVLQIADDGSGVSSISTSRGHGLRNMRTRAAALGGRLDIRGNHPRGTVVELAVPVQ